MKDGCRPLIEDILHIVVTIYRKKPQAEVLEVAKTVSFFFCFNGNLFIGLFKVVILFGKVPELQQMNQQLIQEICNQTLQVCSESNSKNQLSDISDLLEGFFVLLCSFIKKVPQLIFNNEVDTVALFQCGK